MGELRHQGVGSGLWVRIFGVVMVGVVALVIVSIPGLVSDSSSSAGWGTGVAIGVVLAAVAISIYVLLRRSLISRLRAGLIAVAMVLAAFGVPVLLLWLFV